MCGIFGKLNFDGRPVAESLLAQMAHVSHHRGPDDDGIYRKGTIGLGFRRLSIIDLAGGHQPMCNEDGTVWIVFNGEIYNFRALRPDLEARGHKFRTNSDTEVLIHLYEEYGTACLQKLNGMFAFAIWDEREQLLFLARDRMGQKPLHYAHVNESLLFASEIQPILQDRAVPRELNREALDHYLTLMYVPAPQTMFRDIMKLPPGHFMTCQHGKLQIQQYWQVDFTNKITTPAAELADQLLTLLDDATRLRMISDVPLGAFLSGGLDSSLIVALMSRHTEQSIKTFAIGFKTGAEWFDERPFAREVAAHIHADHTEEVISPQMMAVLPKLVWHYGEPFGDNSAVPTYYVSKLARQKVTVALSGDGGDELFGGYGRYTRYHHLSPALLWRALAADSVRGLQTIAARANTRVTKSVIRNLYNEFTAVRQHGRDATEQYLRLVDCFSFAQRSRLYSDELIVDAQRHQARHPFHTLQPRLNGSAGLDRWFNLDLHTYLPDDILVKVDIASMASSLEVRSPFLDYRVVELAASIPSSYKVHNGMTKLLLKEAAHNIVPPAILNRPKWGFGTPVHDWLRGELQPVARDLLLDGRLQARGLFHMDYIKTLLEEHVAQRASNGHNLWLLLNLELWFRTFIDGEPAMLTL